MSFGGALPKWFQPDTKAAWQRSQANRPALEVEQDLIVISKSLRNWPKRPSAAVQHCASVNQTLAAVAHSGPCSGCGGTHAIPRTDDVAQRLAAVKEAIDKRATDDDDDVFAHGVRKGTMLGVLLCLDSAGRLVELKAFAGLIAGSGNWEGWCGPVPSMRGGAQYFANFADQTRALNDEERLSNPAEGTTWERTSTFPKNAAHVGACAAPKLIQHAIHANLVPIALAEMWVGEAHGWREDGLLYASCETCRDNIGFQLCGRAARVPARKALFEAALEKTRRTALEAECKEKAAEDKRKLAEQATAAADKEHEAALAEIDPRVARETEEWAAAQLAAFDKNLKRQGDERRGAERRKAESAATKKAEAAAQEQYQREVKELEAKHAERSRQLMDEADAKTRAEADAEAEAAVPAADTSAYDKAMGVVRSLAGAKAKDDPSKTYEQWVTFYEPSAQKSLADAQKQRREKVALLSSRAFQDKAPAARKRAARQAETELRKQRDQALARRKATEDKLRDESVATAKAEIERDILADQAKRREDKLAQLDKEKASFKAKQTAFWKERAAEDRARRIEAQVAEGEKDVAAKLVKCNEGAATTASGEKLAGTLSKSYFE